MPALIIYAVRKGSGFEAVRYALNERCVCYTRN